MTHRARPARTRGTHKPRTRWFAPVALAASTLLGAITPPLVAHAAPTLPEGWTGQVMVKFRPATAQQAERRTQAYRAAQTTKRLPATPKERRRLHDGTVLIDGAGDAKAVIEALSKRADVEYAIPDRRVRRASNDPLFGSQWNLKGTGSINVEPVWSWTGSGVTVAVVDSGKTAHPDLAGQFVGGYDFIDDSATGGDGNGRDADATDTGDFCRATGDPSSWHGTLVASAIAALRDNGRDIAGVAPKAKILPLRVLGRCGGVESDVIDAIAWASGAAVPGLPANAHRAKVINLSLATVEPSSCSPAMAQVIAAARTRGSLVVSAAGNESQNANLYAPGNCAGVINVAASTRDQRLASYSNAGTAIDLAAPGGDGAAPLALLGVNSTSTNNGDYGAFQAMGTSFAAPHVSGVAALLWHQRPSLTVAQVEDLLVRRARTAPNCSGCGAGIVDAQRALTAVQLTSIRWQVTPLHGGTPITFRGSGFSAVTRVLVGGQPVTSFRRVSDTTITGVMPAHAAPGAYPVVMSAGGNLRVGNVAYVDRPEVTALSAQNRPAGSIIRVTGRNFLPGTTADIDGVPATVTAVESPTSLLMRIPVGTTGRRGIVHVTTSMGTSSGTKGSIYTWG